MKVPAPLLVIALLTAMGGPSLADDLSYVATEELLKEIQARETDLQRTDERIQLLTERVTSLEQEVSTIKAELKQIEVRLSEKASLLYRLSRNGKAVRYLFSAASGTAFLKRIETLKKLVTSEMEELRQKGLWMEETTAALETARQAVEGARTMRSELESLRNDLLMEKSRRETETLARY